jgi:hypothetical protein
VDQLVREDSLRSGGKCSPPLDRYNSPVLNRIVAKLPFVVQPRLKPVQEEIGTEISGKILVERRGYLTVSEKMFVQAGLKEDNSQNMLFQLVNKISVEQGIPAKQVLEDMSGGGSLPEYAQAYTGELTSVMERVNDLTEKTKLLGAAALLITRVDPEIDIEDVMGLHPELIEELYRLYIEEENCSLDRLKSRDELAGGEGELGKDQEAS